MPTYTTKNLIQKPIFETRQLLSVGTLTSAGTLPSFGYLDEVSYKIIGTYLYFNVTKINITGGTAGSGANQITIALPFEIADRRHTIPGTYSKGGTSSASISGQTVEGQSVSALLKSGSALTCADLADANIRELHIDGYYEI